MSFFIAKTRAFVRLVKKLCVFAVKIHRVVIYT